MKVILYCGDRNWDDSVSIHRSFDRESPDHIISGGARGADDLAEREALLRNIPAEIHYADWERYGRAAGPVRNEQMLKSLLHWKGQGAEIKVVAFHSDLESSKGTKSMVLLAKAKNVEVEVIV